MCEMMKDLKNIPFGTKGVWEFPIHKNMSSILQYVYGATGW